MYYLGKSGKVFNEQNIENAFELIYGISPSESEMYDSFHAAVSIDYVTESIKEGRKETIDFLIEHDARAMATLEYKKLYGCDYKEAYYKVGELMKAKTA